MSIPFSTGLGLILIGLSIGTISGMVGIGGGILVIPVLMFFFGFSQAQANGTSLAMLLPPIGIFAVLVYHRAGNINWTFAALLACGFAVGAFAGSKAINGGWIHPTLLRVSFALLLVYCAGRLLFHSGDGTGAALQTSLLVVAFAVVYGIMRLLGRHWGEPPDWGVVYRRKRESSGHVDYEI